VAVVSLVCAATVRFGPDGELAEPRRCRRNARAGSHFCGVHGRLSKRVHVEVRDGGWCVWCAGAGRVYTSSADLTVTQIPLCDRCLGGIFRAAPRSARITRNA
jgi:hypothetical protein